MFSGRSVLGIGHSSLTVSCGIAGIGSGLNHGSVGTTSMISTKSSSSVFGRSHGSVGTTSSILIISCVFDLNHGSVGTTSSLSIISTAFVGCVGGVITLLSSSSTNGSGL